MDVESKLTKSLDDLIKERGASGDGNRRGRGRGRGRSAGRGGGAEPVRGRGGADRGSERQQRDTNGRGRGRGRTSGGATGGQKRARNDDGEEYIEIRVARRIYVQNLSAQTRWQDLKDCFRAAGNVVHAEVGMDGQGRGARSKGWGIVEFERPEEAAHAISHLHLTMLDGHEIRVREDREDRELLAETGGAPRGGGNKRGRPSDDRSGNGAAYSNAGGTQIVVHGLPYATTWQDLKGLTKTVTAAAGREVKQARTEIVMGDDNRSRGYGTVRFDSHADAAAAIEAFGGYEHEGRVLSAKLDKFA